MVHLCHRQQSKLCVTVFGKKKTIFQLICTFHTLHIHAAFKYKECSFAQGLSWRTIWLNILQDQTELINYEASSRKYYE
jgi:hypothetical protein